MEILSIYLKFFKPLLLNNIEEFEYSMKKLLQIILGTNGSGKSSLLRVCSPEPAEGKDFLPGGIKLIIIRNTAGDLFELKSQINKTVSHSFMMNNIELNEGGTLTVQKELVTKHLRYDAFLHKILTGQIEFTRMSPNARKELLQRISNTDLTYATKIYDCVQKEQRDCVGALKFITGKCADLNKRIMPDEKITDLKKEAEDFTAKLNALMPLTNNSVNGHDRNEVLGNLETEHRILRSMLDSVFKEFTRINTTFEIPINRIMGELKYTEEQLAIVNQNHLELSEKMNQVKGYLLRLEGCPQNESAQAIRDNITELSRLLNIEVKEPLSTGPLELALNDVTGLMGLIKSPITEWDNHNGYFHLTDINEANLKHATLKSRLSDLARAQTQLGELINHAELAKIGEVTCPKCETLILGEGGITVVAMADLVTRYDNGELERTALSNQILTMDVDVMVPINNQNVFLAEIRRLLNIYPAAASVVRCLRPCEVINHPNTLWALLEGEVLTLRKQMVHSDYRVELVKQEEYLTLIELKDNIDDQATERLEESLHDVLTVKGDLDKYYSTLNRYGRQVQLFYKHVDELDVQIQTVAALISKAFDISGYVYANDSVAVAQTALAELRKGLDDARHVKEEFDRMEVDHLAYKQRKHGHDLLAKYLSPKDGIIAKTLRTILCKFSEDVNSIVATIWEQKLEVLPYSNAKSLNFKMPLALENGFVDDISIGSRGQQDIINLAVTFNVLAYLKLNNYPLFFDEVGSSFDVTHRSNFVRFISNLMTTGACSQLFMVNHYAAEYGALSEAEYVVLNTKNIVKPDVYNENVRMS